MIWPSLRICPCVRFSSKVAPLTHKTCRTCHQQKKEKRQKGETFILHAQFVADVSEGITKILSSDRIPTRESKKDLLRCIELLVSTDPQPFEWNIDMYTDERKTPQERVPLNFQNLNIKSTLRMTKE